MDTGSNGTSAGRSKPGPETAALGVPRSLNLTGPMCVFTS